MAFDWKEYLELSRFLLRQGGSAGNQEAFLRSAVSRAYYAAFCHTRNYARSQLGFRSRDDADDHGALRQRLKKGKMRGISDKLQQLREWRNDCDYKDELKFDLQSNAAAALALASRVFTSSPFNMSFPPLPGGGRSSDAYVSCHRLVSPPAASWGRVCCASDLPR